MARGSARPKCARAACLQSTVCTSDTSRTLAGHKPNTTRAIPELPSKHEKQAGD